MCERALWGDAAAAAAVAAAIAAVAAAAIGWEEKWAELRKERGGRSQERLAFWEEIKGKEGWGVQGNGAVEILIKFSIL